jgi:hypothetical protein
LSIPAAYYIFSEGYFADFNQSERDAALEITPVRYHSVTSMGNLTPYRSSNLDLWHAETEPKDPGFFDQKRRMVGYVMFGER